MEMRIDMKKDKKKTKLAYSFGFFSGMIGTALINLIFPSIVYPAVIIAGFILLAHIARLEDRR